VPFQVESYDLSAVAACNFRYPQLDKPFAEDPGRCAREINTPAI
jgi:hypothetical protein